LAYFDHKHCQIDDGVLRHLLARHRTKIQTTHDAKSKQVSKNLKESDRNEKIVLFDEKSFEYQEL
jgi:hypothetical protein